jgi:hypothetical protein
MHKGEGGNGVMRGKIISLFSRDARTEKEQSA